REMRERNRSPESARPARRSWLGRRAGRAVLAWYLFEIGGRRRTANCQKRGYYYQLSPCSPRGSEKGLNFWPKASPNRAGDPDIRQNRAWGPRKGNAWGSPQKCQL